MRKEACKGVMLVMMWLGMAGCAQTMSDASEPASAHPSGKAVTVQPREIDAVLDNPGMGLADFHFGFGHPPSTEEYPHATVAYFRWPWAELEPAEGQYNFALVDQVIAAGQG